MEIKSINKIKSNKNSTSDSFTFVSSLI